MNIRWKVVVVALLLFGSCRNSRTSGHSPTVFLLPSGFRGFGVLLFGNPQWPDVQHRDRRGRPTFEMPADGVLRSGSPTCPTVFWGIEYFWRGQDDNMVKIPSETGFPPGTAVSRDQLQVIAERSGAFPGPPEVFFQPGSDARSTFESNRSPGSTCFLFFVVGVPAIGWDDGEGTRFLYGAAGRDPPGLPLNRP